jgi:hypothetical protein
MPHVFNESPPSPVAVSRVYKGEFSQIVASYSVVTAFERIAPACVPEPSSFH